jgi:hypothetical protein
MLAKFNTKTHTNALKHADKRISGDIDKTANSRILEITIWQQQQNTAETEANATDFTEDQVYRYLGRACIAMCML